MCLNFLKTTYVCSPINYAQMAELVDALVSNTNVLGRAGSTPALGTKKVRNSLFYNVFASFFI